MQGGKENKEGATTNMFYFISTNGTRIGRKFPRAHKTSLKSFVLLEITRRLTEHFRLNRDLLILGFSCNPNRNSLISCYHICELMRPRCSGCQKNLQTSSSWDRWPIPSTVNLPFMHKTSRNGTAR